MGVSNYLWLVSLSPYDAVDSIELRFSDGAFTAGGKQYEPGITQWAPIMLGMSTTVGNAYFQARGQLEVLVRSYDPQGPDDTIITLMQERTFINAPVTISYLDQDAASPSPITVFTGVVERLSVSREVVQFNIKGEDATSERPAIIMSTGRYPNLRGVDEGSAIPLLIGECGWTPRYLLRDMNPFDPSLLNDPQWRYLVPSRGMSESRLTDSEFRSLGATLSRLYRPCSTDGGEQDTTEMPGPQSVVFWSDDPRSPMELMDTFEADDGVLPIEHRGGSYALPTILPSSGDYLPETVVTHHPTGGPKYGQFRARRLHVPNDWGDENAYEPGAVVPGWDNIQNAFDRTDLRTYATIEGGTAGADWELWLRGTGRFVRYPSRPALKMAHAEPTDPPTRVAGREYVVALVYGMTTTNTNTRWRFALKSAASNEDVWIVDLRGLAGGWAIAAAPTVPGFEAQFGAQDDLIAFVGTATAGRRWWGENPDAGFPSNPDDGISIQVLTGDGATLAEPPRVALLGICAEHICEPGPLVGLNKSGYLRALEMRGDQGRPVTIMSGYYPQTVSNTTPGTAVPQFLVDATLKAKVPITPGDIDTAGGFGSYNGLDADLGLSLDDTSNGTEGKFRIGAVENTDVPISTMLTKLSQSVLADFWYSPRTGLHRTQIFRAGQPAHGATLVFADLTDGTISVNQASLDEVYTSVYVHCWQGSRVVHIDTAPDGVRRYDGAGDATLETQADEAQARYGRRNLEVELPYINDPVCAWDVCVRIWDLHRSERPRIQFSVSAEWALAREQSEVFTTDASLDDVIPVPVLGQTSWAGLTWQIRDLRIQPGGVGTVVAVWNDSFS